MSRIRTNLITNRMANGAPTVSNGLVISGVTTTSDIKVGTGVTLNVYGGATFSGIVTASSFSGIDTDKISEGNTEVETIDTGSDGHIKLTTEGNERLRIKSNGQIVLGSDGTNSELTFTQDGTSGTQLNATTTGSGGYNTLSINSATFIHKYGSNERLRIDSSGQFALGRTGQITANGNQSTSVFEQLSNNNYPLALHSAQTNNRGLAIFYATTGAGNAGDPFIVCTDNTNNKFQVTSDGTITNRGNILPAVNNSKDLGSSSLRWANLYTQDLQLSNEAKKDTGGNSVDGTWGDWTLQEGESDVFMINNRNGKKYMFMLKEVV